METDGIAKAIFLATAVLTRLESARRLCCLTIVHLSRRHYTNKIWSKFACTTHIDGEATFGSQIACCLSRMSCEMWARGELEQATATTHGHGFVSSRPAGRRPFSLIFLCWSSQWCISCLLVAHLSHAFQPLQPLCVCGLLPMIAHMRGQSVGQPHLGRIYVG